MSGQLVSAVFWLSAEEEWREEPPEDDSRRMLKNSLEQMGAKNFGTTPFDPFVCQWAGLFCRPFMIHCSFHDVLFLQFFYSKFLELEFDDPENGQKLAQSFQAACKQLNPEVAYIVNRPQQANVEWNLDREWMVLALEAPSLTEEHFGVLYMCQEVCQHWSTRAFHQTYRDIITVPTGCFVFCGQKEGEGRWM